MHRHTGDDQVANPRKPEESLRGTPHRDPEAGHLRHTARDDRGAGVIPEAHTMGNTGSQSNHVLECTAELHPSRVAVDIHTELQAHKDVLHFTCRRQIRASGDDRGRKPGGNLLGVRGAGQCDYACIGDITAENVLDDFRHRHQRLALDPLHHRDDQLPRRDIGLRLHDGGAQVHGRHGEQQEVTPGNGVRDILLIPNSVIQLHVRQIRVPVRGRKVINLLWQSRPDDDPMTIPCQRLRQSDSPSAGAKYTYLFHVSLRDGRNQTDSAVFFLS